MSAVDEKRQADVEITWEMEKAGARILMEHEDIPPYRAMGYAADVFRAMRAVALREAAQAAWEEETEGQE